jgi:hypothetical protein
MVYENFVAGPAALLIADCAWVPGCCVCVVPLNFTVQQ